MAFYWTAELDPGMLTTQEDLETAGIGIQFDDQASAEAWLGQHFEDLLDLGVSATSLFEDDKQVYGTMSLEP